MNNNNDDVFAQLDAAQERPRAVVTVNTPAPSPDDAFAQLDAVQHADKQVLTQIIGEHAATQEVQQNADRLASQPKPAPDPAFAPEALRSDNLKQTAGEVLHGLAQVPEGIYSGAVHAVSELGSSVAYLATLNTPQMAYEWLDNHYGGGKVAAANQARLKAVQGGIRGAADAVTPDIDTTAGQLTKGITQFTAAFIPISRAMVAAEGARVAARIGANVLAGGTTQAAAFNPDDKRLSDLIESSPTLQNPVNEFLASKPGDAEAEGRLKNFLEGAGLSAATDAAVEGFTSILKAMRATKNVAENVAAVANAEPTAVDLHGVDSNIEVHEEELTDEQRRLFGLGPMEEGAGAPRPSGEEGSAAVRSGSSGPAKPITVYRGSTQPLTDEHFADEALGFASQKNAAHLGVYFTDNAEEAADHGVVTEHQLYLKNPKALKTDDIPDLNDPDEARAYREQAKAAGHDGLVLDYGDVGGNKHYVAFTPDALKAPEKPTAQPDISTQQAGDPAGIVHADTATPQAARAITFDAATAARDALRFDTSKTKDILGYITDGRYSEIPSMLDDTHRTIPWETLSDGANLQSLFNAMEANFGGMIKAAHGTGVVGDAQIVQLAKDIGGDPAKLAQTFNNVTDQGGLAAQITAGYNMMVASARQLRELAEIARPLRNDSAEGAQAIVEFEKQLQLHAAIVGQVRGSSAEIGRALYAHRALKASSAVQLQNISDLAGSVLGPKALDNFLETIGGSASLADINNAVDRVRGNGLVNVIKEVAQNGMLSGITTQLANIGGNAANAIIKVSERYLAGAIGQVRGVLMPNAEVATLRAAVAHTVGAVKGVQEAFPLFVKALVHEPEATVTGAPVQRAIYRSTDGRAGADLALSRVINIAGEVVRYPGRFMGAIDNLNMGIGYQGDLAARSYTLAASEADANGLLGEARETFMQARMADMRANPPADVQARALDAGRYQSFQEAAKTRFGKAISSTLNSHPLVKLLVAPFVHRPLNMLRQSLMDYTALGLTSASQRSLLAAGNADSDLAIARMVIGTSALAYSYNLASNGVISGAGLGIHNTESLDGVPKDSIKIGDTWHQYSRVDPLGLWLAIGADLHEHVTHHYDPNNPESTNDLATLTRMAVQTVGSAAMDKSFMASVDQLLQALSEKDPARAEVLVQRLLAGNVSKFVPFSGALRTEAQREDSTVRATGGDGLANIWDTVKKNLPGLSQDLPPRRDILGRPIVRPEDSWWNPFAGARANTDRMDIELSKVAAAVRSPPRQLDGVVLDAKTYDELITRSTEAKIFEGGQMDLREFLAAWIRSDDWTKFNHTDDNGTMVHAQMVQQAIDAAYSYGKQSFLQAHPDFLDKQRQIAVQRAGHARLPATVE